MPPGDTTQPPSHIQALLDSLWQTYNSNTPDYKEESKLDPNFVYPLMLYMVIFIVLLFLYDYWKMKNKRKERQEVKKLFRKTIAEEKRQMEFWLEKYNPYYNSLNHELRDRFLMRTMDYMQSKQFRFHAMVEESYIPALISASAVQLTFGLKDFRMDHFDVIHVIRKEYHLNIDNDTYYGHVTKKGIHISWSRFLEGYNDYTDSENVGLHEMAHALSYDIYLGNEEGDEPLKARLNEFAEEVRPVFRMLRTHSSHFYDHYSLSNFDEFWATSIELFFENPLEFKEKLPHLYREISVFLNQDPLSDHKIIDHSLA